MAIRRPPVSMRSEKIAMADDDWKACRQELDRLIASTGAGTVRDQSIEIIERFKTSLDTKNLGVLEGDLQRAYDRIKPPAQRGTFRTCHSH
jgi:hypothetical protein